jgi:hypothetical protein
MTDGLLQSSTRPPNLAFPSCSTQQTLQLFLPIDSAYERYEELAPHPDWSFFGSQHSKRELLEWRRPGPRRIDA